METCVCDTNLQKAPLSDPRNNRPITITSIFARTLEKILKKHILLHLECNDIISKNHFGFLKGRSVETTVLTSLNDWSKAFEEKGCMDIVYFDFLKAFDKVSVKKLIFKKEVLGIRHMTINWIRQFLFGRTHQVAIKGEYSKVFLVTSSVPVECYRQSYSYFISMNFQTTLQGDVRSSSHPLAHPSPTP